MLPSFLPLSVILAFALFAIKYHNSKKKFKANVGYVETTTREKTLHEVSKVLRVLGTACPDPGQGDSQFVEFCVVFG